MWWSQKQYRPIQHLLRLAARLVGRVHQMLLPVLPAPMILGDIPASDAAGTLTFAVVVDNPLAAGVTEINNAVSIADDGNNGDDPTPG